MPEYEARVSSVTDASCLSMTADAGALRIKKDFHSYQVYLTWVSALNLQKPTFVIPALYLLS